MSVTVRDIITEAAARANINPRKKVLPEDQFVSALQLFNGVLEEFSSKNYIDAYQNEVDFNPHSSEVFVGEKMGDHVNAPNLQLPTKMFYKYAGSIDWTPMEFISYNNFYSSNYSDYIVSWQPVGPNLYKVHFKPRFLQNNPECKLIYNVEMKYSDNDPVNLPTPYIELITRALAYKLSIRYPRVDVTKQNSLKLEFETLENALKANNASTKIITRGGNAPGGSYQSYLRSGGFIADNYF